MAAGSIQVDIGIITVLESELEAIMEYIPSYATVTGRRHYNLCRLKTDEGAIYQIGVVRGLGSGHGEAVEVGRDLMEELSPRWLLVVGIAGGVGSRANLGDVVVSTELVDFSSETVLPTGHYQYSLSSGRVAREAAIAIANIPALSKTIAGWEKLRFLRPSSLPTGRPHVYTGVVASSDRVVNDYETILRWTKHVRGIQAIDMESAGLYRVASRRKIPFFTIRGIASNLGKLDNVPIYASYTAASFTAAFLRTQPLQPIPQASKTSVLQPSQAESVLIARDQVPFVLKEVRLEEVRGFDSLGLSLLPPAAPTAGQWLILLGPNGVGKTTILRALALVLSSDEVVQALLGRLGIASPMVRIGASTATIQIEAQAGQLPRITLQAGETGNRLEARGSGEASTPFIVAYGCRRGSALGGATREVNAISPLSAVETLFEEGASLVHAETWLKERKLAATLNNGSAESSFFQAVIAALIELLPGVSSIEVGADMVQVDGPHIGRCPLGALSDGYLTTAGWIIDMIARWAEDTKRRGGVLDGSFLDRMTGVAIVDEIDLHLHPKWQREVITSVRRHFPCMSFIVTTHNPLSLLGGQAGEIFVVQRNEETKRISVEQRDLPPGTDAERILTGEWFGLASTLDDNTLGLLEKHRQLLRDGQADSPEAKALEAELTARLGSYAATSVERMAQSVAAQVLDEDLRNLSTKDRQEAREEIGNILRPKLARPKTSRKKPKTS